MCGGKKRFNEQAYLDRTFVVLAAQLFCWTGQFIGHGIFEKRAPALLDNLAQAFLMAPYFVFLELGSLNLSLSLSLSLTDLIAAESMLDELSGSEQQFH
ncbi:putative endoplasmic reticulum membrane protein C16E8.02 [Camellia lanceoleosa]|nr:putative endoplasmic reticulum membrane protein C16E8.02 [Camellia lanceoleosa]